MVPPPRDTSAQARLRAHLEWVVGPVHRALRAAAEARGRHIARLARPDMVERCVMPDQVALLLDEVEGGRVPPRLSDDAITAEEHRALQAIERRPFAERPPLSRLAAHLELDAFEVRVVALCARLELEPAYGRIIAFILDDLHRRLPCAELFVQCGPPAEAERRLLALEPSGLLRRCGVVEPAGPTALGRMAPLRLTGRARRFVLGDQGCVEGFGDPALVTPFTGALPPSADPERVAALRRGVTDGTLDAIGVWSHDARMRARVVACLADALPLREIECDAAEAVRRRTAELCVARGEGVWLRAVEPRHSATLAWWVRQPLPLLVLDGETSWRPPLLLDGRRFAEWQGRTPDIGERRRAWRGICGADDHAAADLLAEGFALGSATVDLVARIAEREAALDGATVPDAGTRGGSADAVHLQRAVRMVTRVRSEGFAEWVEPRRRLGDLVLQPATRDRVVDVVRFARGWSSVAARWGLDDGGGVRALFTGPPGTGKTLSAEVIAGELGSGMLRVDLARVVSKWVGETEKNLDAAFKEAEQSHAVLFFDEAEALFGKRGDVKGGTDRYANLEVAYLLQRLEQYRGVVVLASNLKQQIDPAFARRFQIVAHFPRPALEQRRALWAAFLARTRVADGLDDALLGRLDMTGADIERAVRTAAFLAEDGGADAIGMCHLVRAVQRQFTQSSRVLRPGELGSHARWLEGSEA